VNNKKVLILGGLGFIGSNLAKKCLELGAEVTVYDNLDSHSGGNLYNIHDFKADIRLLFYVILNVDLLSQEISKAEIIFNCAASTSHPFSMKEPWIDLDVNSRGVINILEIIRKFNKECKFIHLGTSTQLGRLIYTPADENHPEFPTDIYSANKSVSEKYVLIYAKAFDIDATVVRLSNVFGPRASIHSPEFTFNNYFIGLALQKKNITVYGDGKQFRNVIYVDDAVDSLIMTSFVTGTKGQTFFAVGDNHYSVAHLAEETSRIMGTGKVDYIGWPANRRAIEIGDAILSNKKIKEVVGWKPKTDLIEGLIAAKIYFEKYLNYYIH
jgi:UDP-glucose 4-epimerase